MRILRVQEARSAWRAAGAGRGGAIVAGAWLGFVLAGCQGPDQFYWGKDMGLGGNLPSGAAGSIDVTGAAGSSAPGTAGTSATGAAGSVMSGAAGSVMSGVAGNAAGGAAGASAVGAGGNPAGSGGSTGAAGSTGAGGRGGPTGTGGAGGAGGGGGRGGTTGAGGAGRGGTTGGGGAGGRAGGAGGGRGGTGGAAGTTGRGGAGGGANACPLGGKLDCTAAGSLDLTPDGQVVDFSASQWNNTTAKWCNADGLDGGLFSFAGTGSTAAAAVDTTARNLKLNLSVSAGQYAGGGVSFDSCVDARGFNSIEFTASVSAGSLNGCVWQVQLQTQDQYPSNATNPTGGTCNATTTTCRRFPAATLTAATATATVFTTRFTAFNNPAASAVPTASQVVGLQWQVNSSNGTGTCMVELRIDSARFVTQ